jgi:hypothetical protein
MVDEERLVFRVATPWFWWTIYEPGQQWTLGRVFNVLIFVVLSPLLILVTLIAGIFSKPVNRDADEVARYLWNEAQGRSSFRDWDDFTSVPIADPSLDEIKIEAASIAPPLDEHRDELLALAQRARLLR